MKTQNNKIIPIIYEDENILAINKPTGLLVHPAVVKDQGFPPKADQPPAEKIKDKTLVDWILEKYPEIKGVGEPMVFPDGAHIDKPGIIHRLDKDTSGIMLIAKNQKTFEFLKKQFQARTIKKIYQAIVWGNIKEDKGKIDKPIGRSPSTGHFLSGRGVRGKMREAVTEYEVIKRFSVETENLQSLIPKSLILNIKDKGSRIKDTIQEFTFLELYPKTGRTHQIRVHLKYINHPIICDKIYASNMPCPVLGLNRLALHAASIEFSLSNNKHMKFEAPLPEDFQQVLMFGNRTSKH